MLVTEINYYNPIDICSIFSKYEGTCFLDSSKICNNYGKYSFIAIKPFKTISYKNIQNNPLELLQQELKQYKTKTIPNLPPFQSGACGFLSYELCHYLENIPKIKKDYYNFPDLYLGLYDLVISFDLINKKSYIFASGKNPNEQTKWVKNKINNNLINFNKILDLKNITIQNNIISNFNEHRYINSVNKVKDYIFNGDIFQANFTQQFSAELSNNLSSFDLYKKLRIHNPAPFSAFINAGQHSIASASPERFLHINNKIVEARPIKGTIKRDPNPSIDKKLSQQLLNSQKDKAENIMIVDLMRNDLSRVCNYNSIRVPKLCELESFATVHHLVSTIKGKLEFNKDNIDLLINTFPGGSITGAPKIRAMEIISELENTRRGPYCGSIGYIGFDGSMDLSITIRTFALNQNKLCFSAGGAIVMDSDPLSEYNESLLKAKALREVLTS